MKDVKYNRPTTGVEIRDLKLSAEMASFLLGYAEMYQSCPEIPWGYGHAYPDSLKDEVRGLVSRGFGKTSWSAPTNKLVKDGVDANGEPKYVSVPDRPGMNHFSASYEFAQYVGELAVQVEKVV